MVSMILKIVGMLIEMVGTIMIPAITFLIIGSTVLKRCA
jgi:hypothetical protein